MASITIRDIDETLKARLRIRAARRGRSMEDEAREILRIALALRTTPSGTLVDVMRRRLKAIGGVDLDITNSDHTVIPS